MLRANLEALARRDPELVQRMGWPVESDHVVLDESGDVHYRLQQSRYRLSLADEAIARALPPEAPANAEVFVFGVGLGEIVDALLSARADVGVVAWERDPWLLRLALGQNDWSAALASGRLRLLLGSDLIEHAAAMRARGAAVLTAFHPFLGTLYRHERAWLDPAAMDRADGARLAERSPSREGPGTLPGFPGQRPLVLLCAGGLFVDDLAAGLGRAGFATYTLDIHRLSREELDRTMGRLRPRLIAGINYTEGLAEFAAAHQCRLICWEIDPSTSAPPRCHPDAAAHAFLFTYRRAQVAELLAGGFKQVEYLPLAADLERRAPVPLTAGERARYGTPVSFVGSSMQPQAAGFRQSFVAALAGANPAADASALLDDVLAEQRRDFTRFVVPDALARRAPDLARSRPDLLAQLVRWAGEIAAAEKRLAYVGRLGRFGVCVWGDEGWRAAQTAGLPCHYRGPAGHGLELTKIYCASLINVDIGRVYQDDIVTMRVFDVLACGGFVLAERSPALAELFELGAEIECYASADELEAKVAHYLAHPEAARAIALRGREAVCARHGIDARVARMLAAARPVG